MEQSSTFGQILRERRARLGLTQAELARRAGCAPITVRKMEGDALRPSVQLAELLALALGVPEEDQPGFVRLARQEKRLSPIPHPTPSPGEIGLDNLTGRAVKGFQLAEMIGAGGFGIVYRAVQPSVQRDVAVKIILPRFANHPKFIRRFEAEAHLVARLEHPHIVPLYDYWREPDAAYLIMRLLRGGLNTILVQGPLPLEIVGRIGRQVGQALAAAHAQGVLHQDIKPANVLLDDQQNGYLADFGIAKNLAFAEGGSLTEQGKLISSPAYISPEQIRDEPVRPSSDIYSFGLLLFEMLTGQAAFQGPTPVSLLQQHLNKPVPMLRDVAPDLPVGLDDVLQRATAKRPQDRFQKMNTLLHAFESALRGQATAVRQEKAVPHLTSQEIAALENPYRGLRPFTEADADSFFGRDTLVQDLLSLMSDGSDLERFVAVVGPSGSGKSSLVKAGLLPALRRGGLPGSENWFVVDLAPGSRPWQEVAAALRRVAVNPSASLLDQLTNDERGLLRAVAHCLPDDGETELLLLIDQFEELFTLVESEAVREAFLQSLVTAVLDPDSCLRLVITLRADFTDRPLQYVDFGELMQQRLSLVLPLTPDELTQAITRPVENLGLTMSPDLIATVIQDVGSQPGMLPLLQYALTELFEQRQGQALTLETYRQTGGVAGALTHRADEIFASLEDTKQEAARQLFLRLVTLGEGVEDTRRRVLLAELDALSTDYRALLTEYGKYRLLTFDHDPVTRGPTVEVAHEALLREWPRLRGWLQDGREDVRQQRLLAQAAAQWRQNDEDASYLLRGSRLTGFEAWSDATSVALTEDERRFLQTSMLARDERQAALEARRQRELETAQQLAQEQTRRAEEQARAAHSLRQRAIILAGALIVAAILTVLATGFANSSNANANLAATRAAEALANFNLAATNEAEAVANAILAATRESEANSEREAAVAAQATTEAEILIRATAEAVAIQERNNAEEQALQSFSREVALAAINELDVDPERSILLALFALQTAPTDSAETALRLALQQSRMKTRFTDHNGDWLIRAVVHPNEPLVASAGLSEVFIWNMDSGEILATIPHEVSKLEFLPVPAMDFSSAGTTLAIGHNETVTLHDSKTGEVQRRFQLGGDLVKTLAFNSEETLLAAGTDKGQLFVWDLRDDSLLFTTQASAGGGLNRLDFSPDGGRIATTGDDGFTRVWDALSGVELLSFGSPVGFPDPVSFSPDGTQLYSGVLDFSGTSEIHIWDVSETAVSTNQPEAILTDLNDSFILDFSISMDGSRLATAGNDNTINIWNRLEPGKEPLVTLTGHTGVGIISINFSPDGRSLISAGADDVRVWDVALAGLGETRNFQANNLGTNMITLDPENQWLALAGADGLIELRNLETGELQLEFTGHAGQVMSVDFSPDGASLASAGTDGTVRLWDINTGDQLDTLQGHGEGITGGIYPGVLAIDFSLDGSRLASGGADGTVRFWDVETGQEIFQFTPHPDGAGIANLQFSPDGQYLAVSTDSPGVLAVWDVSERKIQFETSPNLVNQFWGLDYSPDGRFIAVGYQNGNLEIFDSGTGQLLSELPGHNSTIFRAMDFSPGGTMLATGDIDGTFRVWDLESERLIVDISGNSSMITGLVFSPYNQQVIVASVDSIVRTYTVDLGELITIAEARLTRTLTDEECRQFLRLPACPHE